MKTTEEFNQNLKNIIDGISFSFGKNWRNYLNSLTPEKIRIAKQSLKEFLGVIKGKSCIDIGSGSGIFSYSMYALDAKEIISIDIDPFSVQCANFLRSKVKHPERWHIFQGSILETKFMSQFGKYDVVYSWGVLHHTGNMWKAIENATKLVNDNGLLFLAIYNKTKTSRFWLMVKKMYNLTPNIGKYLMNFLLYSGMYFIVPLASLKNPFIKLNTYKKNRAMDPMTDIKDWLGGYPYEVATFDEIVTFLNEINQNFKLVKFKKVKPNVNANHELVFKKIK